MLELWFVSVLRQYVTFVTFLIARTGGHYGVILSCIPVRRGGHLLYLKPATFFELLVVY